MQPHPYSNQDIVAVRRGPIIYCVEDVDNPWVKNHFRDVAIDPSVSLREVGKDPSIQDFIIISAPKAGALLESSPWNVVSQQKDSVPGVVYSKSERKDLTFIPYYARANRGGSGQMRVGLRILR